MRQNTFISILVILVFSFIPCSANADKESMSRPYLSSYDRLLPLEGGSNFRDMGGYFTKDGRQVRRGILFRSAAPTSLTRQDQEFLAQFGFKRIIDMRSTEERDLYPNHWAREQHIEVLYHDYSIREIVERMVDDSGDLQEGMHKLYRFFPDLIRPQVKMVFEQALEGNVPLVVNCSAGQDRTGFASALLLIALGVPREVVSQDYLQSTRYRRPDLERGDVDLEKAAEDNWFAELMLRYSDGEGAEYEAEPLLTDNGVPYLRFALDQIEQEYGSVEAYLNKELGVDSADIEKLRERYLVATFKNREGSEDAKS